ncbi:MAG: quinate 5-dehydrogenase [Armatimonadetes bacterium]|nr:quinate 5-dehydrogenase [Armatimonadota bacterium]
MKQVVSVSLGSRKGDLEVETEFLGQRFRIRREGTDGDFRRALERITALDGQVDAIGLGGIDLYVYAGGRRYTIRDAARLAARAQKTPVVDGSGIKHTLERQAVCWLDDQGVLPLRGCRTLLVSAVDRFGMAEALAERGADVIYGDLIFGLGLPIPIRSIGALRRLARAVLPIVTRLPFQWFYPTGKQQETFQRRSPRYYHWAELLAGDFHYVRRYLPPRVDGKVVLTNTVRAHHVEMLAQRGIRLLVTTTPEFGGHSFATNVMEGVLVALLEKRPAEATEKEYLDLLARLGWSPRLTPLSV